MMFAERHFPQLAREYEKLKGWNPGGAEWTRRRNLQKRATDMALEMEKLGLGTDLIIEGCKWLLDRNHAGYSLGQFTHINPENQSELIEPTAIFMKLPGMDKHKEVGGFVVWYEGMAQEGSK